MKWSDPGSCPTASFGKNSTEYVGSGTWEFISYSFPKWHGLHLETENVKTLTMVNNCDTLDLILKQIVKLFQITIKHFIICILSTLNNIFFQNCYYFSSLERYTIQTTYTDTATGAYNTEQCFFFSMMMCITNILSVWLLYKWSQYFYYCKVQGYFLYMTITFIATNSFNSISRYVLA
jgi:hypothetical protein